MTSTKNKKFYIPTNEIKVSFSRSSGAGGQNVNKVSSKVIARWQIKNSSVLTTEQKNRLRVKLANRINLIDELVVTSETERSQLQNRILATAKLRTLVTKALYKPKKRQATKPSKSSKLKAVESNKKHSRLKAERRMR